MRHQTEEQLVRLVLNDLAPEDVEERPACLHHIESCPACRLKYEELGQALGSLREVRAVPPVSGWSRLKRSLERSRRPVRDWTEPRWIPLVLIHLGAVLFALVLMMALGGWLESSPVWQLIARIPIMSRVGPRVLVGLVFLIAGGLCVLALTPALLWEYRRRRNLCR